MDEELSQGAKNVLAVLLMYAAKEHYPDTLGRQFSGDLTPFSEYLSGNEENGRNFFKGFAELWEFAGLSID